MVILFSRPQLSARNKSRQRGSLASLLMGRNALLLCLGLGILRLCYMPESMKDLCSFEGDEDDYSLAIRQSLGFFDDITSSHWERMQEKFIRMSPNFCDWGMWNSKASVFWQCHYEPDFVCQHEERIGLQGDGGKWVCDPHRIAEKVDNGGSCLIYSIGSKNKFEFEVGVKEEIHKDCEIHTFDFGKYWEAAAEVGVNYHQWGMGADTPNGRFKSLSTTVEDLGHQNREIDLFKIDCEGCELETAVNWFEAAAKHNIMIRQIQVELHGKDATKIHAFFDLLYEQGYVIFHKEINVITMEYHKNAAVEYAFLKLDPDFVNAASRRKGSDVLAEKRNEEK